MPEDIQQLESRHTPASLGPLISGTFRIRVPPAFQAYLIRKRESIAWIGIAVVAVIPSVAALLSSRHDLNPGEFVHIPIMLAGIFAWRKEMNKPWFYELLTKDAKLVSVSKSGWSWYHLSWNDNRYSTIERDTWNGLPALVVKRRSMIPWQRAKLLLVYSPDDHRLIDEQVVPFMQKRGLNLSEGAWYQGA